MSLQLSKDWIAYLKGQITDVLIWQDTEDFSDFCTNNNVVSLTDLTKVQLTGWGGHTMDAGSYTNCDKLVLCGMPGMVIVDAEDGVIFSDGGLPILNNDINITFNNTSDPVCDTTGATQPHLFVGERCAIYNSGTKEIILSPDGGNDPYIYNYGLISTTTGCLINATKTGLSTLSFNVYTNSQTEDGAVLCSEANTQLLITMSGPCYFETQTGFTDGTVTMTSPAISGPKTFTSQYHSIRKTDTADGGTGDFTCDWNDGNCHFVELVTGTAGTITFSNPLEGGRYLLELKQPASGTEATVVWPGDVEWGDAGEPTLSTTNGQTDVVALYYNGQKYAASYGPSGLTL